MRVSIAAITPPKHKVRVIHQQVEQIDFDSDADVIAISFFSGFANAAYHLANEYKKRNKKIIGGGPHVTYNEESTPKFNAGRIVAGSPAIVEKEF